MFGGGGWGFFVCEGVRLFVFCSYHIALAIFGEEKSASGLEKRSFCFGHCAELHLLSVF